MHASVRNSHKTPPSRRAPVCSSERGACTWRTRQEMPASLTPLQQSPVRSQNPFGGEPITSSTLPAQPESKSFIHPSLLGGLYQRRTFLPCFSVSPRLTSKECSTNAPNVGSSNPGGSRHAFREGLDFWIRSGRKAGTFVGRSLEEWTGWKNRWFW